MTTASLPGRGHRGLEGRHQVHHLVVGGRLGRSGHHLSAGVLGVHQVEHVLAVGVAVAARLPLGRQRRHQLLGHRQFAFGDLDALELVELGEVGRGVELVLVDHHRQEQPAVDRPHDGHVLLGAHHEAGDGHLAGLLHRRHQQCVGLRAAPVGRHVVGPVEVDGIHLGEVHELLEVDGVGGPWLQRGQVVLGDHHVAALGDLVALRDGLGWHLAAVLGVHLAGPDPRAVARVDLIEPDVPLGDGRVQLHRDVDETEADRSAPDGTCHGALLRTAPSAGRPASGPAGEKATPHARGPVPGGIGQAPESTARATRSVPNAVRIAR